MSKRSFNKRQMAIINLIIQKKSAKERILTLDEIEEFCKNEKLLPRVSEGNERQTIIATMNSLVASLQDSNVSIAKVHKIGRGNKCEFLV